MTATERPSPSEARDWEEIASRPEFQVLRHRLRSFVFPMTGLFLAWYLLTEIVPREFTTMAPYVTTLLVLAFASQRLRMPAADGQIYRKGSAG